jgi:hypothetical protein
LSSVPTAPCPQNTASPLTRANAERTALTIRRCAASALSQPSGPLAGPAKKRSTTASKASPGRKPVEDRSFSPNPSSTITSPPDSVAMIAASSIALRSVLEKIGTPGGTTPRRAKARARATPMSDKPHWGIGSSGSMTTSGCVM